jgi:hypothetical protein
MPYVCATPPTDPYALSGAVRAGIRALAADLVAADLDVRRRERETDLDAALALRIVREAWAAEEPTGEGLVGAWRDADLAERLHEAGLPDERADADALRAAMRAALRVAAEDEAAVEADTLEAAREAGEACADEDLRDAPAAQLAARLAAGPWEPAYRDWDRIAYEVGYALGLVLPRRDPGLALAPMHRTAACEGYAERVLAATGHPLEL